MAHAYCDDCGADVTVRDGRCLLDHPIEGPVLPGRASRARSSRGRVDVARRSAPPPTTPSTVTAVADVTGARTEDDDERLPPAEPAPDVARTVRPAARHVHVAATPPPVAPAAPPPAPEAPSWSRRLSRLPMLEMLGFSMPEQSVAVLVPPVHDAPAAGGAQPTDVARRSPVGRVAAPTPRRPRATRPDTTTVDLRLTDVADATAPVSTDVLVERLWERTEDVPMSVDDLAPDARPTVDAPTRRWGLTVASLVAIGLVAFAVSALLARPDSARKAEAARLATLVDEARTVVADGPPMVEVLTALNPDPGDLADATGWLARLDTTARALQARPQRPDLAFAPGDLWAPFAPIDAMLAEQGDRLLAVGDELAAAVGYRLGVLRAFDLPPLSVEADEERQAELAAELAEVRAATATILAELPDHPAFTEHRRRAETLLASFDTWQADYLGALREGDALEATRLTVALRLDIDELRSGLETPLGLIRADALTTLTEVDRALADAALRLSRIR